MYKKKSLWPGVFLGNSEARFEYSLGFLSLRIFYGDPNILNGLAFIEYLLFSNKLRWANVRYDQQVDCSKQV